MDFFHLLQAEVWPKFVEASALNSRCWVSQITQCLGSIVPMAMFCQKTPTSDRVVQKVPGGSGLLMEILEVRGRARVHSPRSCMRPIHSYCWAPPSELGDYDNEEHVKDYATDDHWSIYASYIHTIEHHLVSLVTMIMRNMSRIMLLMIIGPYTPLTFILLSTT